MKSFIIFILLLTLIWSALIGIYNCGEMEGQETQYSYSLFKNYPAIEQNGKTWKYISKEEHFKDYTQLHQFSGGWFNPICGEVFNPFHSWF